MAKKTKSTSASPKVTTPKVATAAAERTPRKPRDINEATPSFAIRKLCLEHPLADVGTIERLLAEQGRTIDGNTLRGTYQGAMGLLKAAGHLGYVIVRK
jgi:hypothetical protein